jgi:GDPmannose 4,6-dehydratase
MKRYFFIGLIFCSLNLSYAEKKALIFGVTGQDGLYLSEFLLEKGYEVHGVKRRSSPHTPEKIDYINDSQSKIKNKFCLHYGDLTDFSSVFSIIEKVRPDEVYNLGAQSQVKVSFEVAEYTAQVDALGTLRILEAIRKIDHKNKIKFYQASISELFGAAEEVPQKESTPFYPRSPYGVAKLYAFWITKNFREAYGMYACNGILFNHESPRRGETFVTRKITKAAARIKLGLQKTLFVGNLDIKRDWGYAKDYIEAMWLMLQQEKADDFVIATNEMHSIRECIKTAFSYLDIEVKWIGEKENEIGVDSKSGEVIVKVDPDFYRPIDCDVSKGDYSKAKNIFGWEPKTKFNELIGLMVQSDLKLEAATK